MLLLRITKYKSLWDVETSLDDIIESEFTDDDGVLDLNLSVYRVEVADVVRVFVEHFASAGNKLPTGKTNVDLADGPGELIPDPVASKFELVAASHCELRFSEGDTLRTFLGRVRDEIATRRREVTSSEIKTYVRARLAANDPPWVGLAEYDKSWKLKQVP